MTTIRTSIALACLSLLIAVGYCAESTADFESANKLYEQGNFEAAAAAYEALIEQGSESAAVYFNLGNAWFRAGENGRAIAAYRVAEQLAPRDPDIQANLKFVISKATGKRPEEIDPNETRYIGLTLKEWTWFSIASVWICMMFLTTREIRPKLKAALKLPTVIAGTFAIITILLTLSAKSKLTEPAAVVTVPEAVVRFGPLEESQSTFTLPDGFEVTVIDKQDGWLRVVDSDSRSGWLKESQVIRWARL